ncbi:MULTISPECIES: 23S rRNA (pseudouridine(1915)-N(3))-methyltransferase RlmH [unclassified Ruminococcus]|uniref:23S rRNA (pseudouridine(1915)-N(3))-methyltransferase RlmH n=1 Tax=unclassified Ruminococcus TaxID=2608920 RepID=UPI00210F1FFF|nr:MULTISPECIES: 23S rRNA (pseudouridine(1915)-N(3))-methyltransferase RlmH [unclassified Ruminococcus]MCQ4021428.1 23S rRNA (pseudouridine(1915)-N(3))-methyltransferase RlmH [Ruminococcus sp. zg-924]MCQ4113873.1 23S rRNA (pseudouridine(1915)-N(3))-methyltransferase RlmH [Ruminococcus sp. zg-921]
MLSVKILCVGKLKEKYLRDACLEYSKRLGAFCRLEIAELAEERISDNPSQSEINRVIEAEGKRLLQKAEKCDAIIAMCIEGKQLSSPELAEFIDKTAVSGVSSIAFVIGGSYGLCDEIKAKSRLKLSMSKMTFPHQLARVMVLEQLYRAFQISSGGKYHK